MEILFKAIVFSLLFFAPAFVHAQDQLGFISLDCGLPRNGSYTEKTSTTINYISDAPFISSGVSNTVETKYKAEFQTHLEHLRSFPEGIRNCYRVNVTKERKYLIRATFLHGNYDGSFVAPTFDLHLGANFWATVKVLDVTHDVYKEIIHVPLQDHVRICLVNTGSGTPFISALELRPMKNDIYVTSSGSLAHLYRIDMGLTAPINYRYPHDIYDRIWTNNINKYSRSINTSTTVDTSKNIYQPPSAVMMSAAIPLEGRSHITLFWDTSDPDLDIVGNKEEFHVYMHFLEVEELKDGQYRAFNITLNGKLWDRDPYVPRYSLVDTISSTGSVISTDQGKFEFLLVQLENSTLPPIINAFEVYSLVDFSKWETDQRDVDAITNIKSNYGVKRNWDGDPCGPLSYMWEGLNCSDDGLNVPRIISLNLSSSGLTGEISSDISKLNKLQSLDLSNNNFSGSVPVFLSQLPNLKFLNLEKNKFSGPIPVELLERSKSGSLSLSVGENPDLCDSQPCKKKKSNSLVLPLVAASIVGLIIVLIIAAMLVACLKKNKTAFANEGSNFGNQENDLFESKKQHFTYSEIVKITNKFKKKLGQGGCGEVYMGSIHGGNKVAVKMIRLPTTEKNNEQTQEYEEKEKEHEWQLQQFHSEVQVLMTVYHGNLTSLVGYCNEGNVMALIYEYMENGDLTSHLSGEREDSLSWVKRLEIARDAAQGLEYLHHGCNPPIIHRDVKAENILLTKNFQAKLADFGLSRIFKDNVSFIQTQKAAGTFGYLDPEAQNSNCFTEKSDVYSFGVVLLQIITGQPAVIRNGHIDQWISIKLAENNGNIGCVVDPRFNGYFEIDIVWKVYRLAKACIFQNPDERPSMIDVVSELRNFLKAESNEKNCDSASEQSFERNEVESKSITSEASLLTTYFRE